MTPSIGTTTKIDVAADKVTVAHVGSANGTVVAVVAVVADVAAATPVPVSPGSVVSIGAVAFMIEPPATDRAGSTCVARWVARGRQRSTARRERPCVEKQPARYHPAIDAAEAAGGDGADGVLGRRLSNDRRIGVWRCMSLEGPAA